MSDNAEKSYLKNKFTLEQIENDCFYGCDDLGAVFTQKIILLLKPGLLLQMKLNYYFLKILFSWKIRISSIQ